MKRLILIVLRFFFELPLLIFQLKYIKKHKDTIPFEERIDWTRRLLKKATKRARVNLTMTGTEYIPETGGFFVAPNHQGLFDILALFDSIKRPFKIVFKKELLDVIFLRDVAEFMEYPAIDRTNLRASMKLMRQVKKEMSAGIPYVIFPEGTRSKKGNELLEFKGGSFKPAMDAQVPIIPCVMHNCFKVLDSNSIKKVDCGIHYLPPIPYEEYKDMNSVEVANLVQSRIQTKMDELIKEHA